MKLVVDFKFELERCSDLMSGVAEPSRLQNIGPTLAVGAQLIKLRLDIQTARITLDLVRISQLGVARFPKKSSCKCGPVLSKERTPRKFRRPFGK